MPGTLILCGTPIGNLGDVSSRLAETLSAVDILYVEDTRRTAKLLNHLGISVRMKSFFAGNERTRLIELADDLGEGLVVALVTDAGMPVVSDPGASAVAVAVANGSLVTSVPGPSAVLTALAMSGLNGDRFVFEGFLPRKGASRRTILSGLSLETRTIVLFSAPSRIATDAKDLSDVLGKDRTVVVTRELTKLHEEIWRGTLEEAAGEFAADDRARGEFTLVVEGASEPKPNMDDAVDAALSEIAEGATTADAVREISAAFGVSRRELYGRVLKQRP